jgi:hypothetical protein
VDFERMALKQHFLKRLFQKKAWQKCKKRFGKTCRTK